MTTSTTSCFREKGSSTPMGTATTSDSITRSIHPPVTAAAVYKRDGMRGTATLHVSADGSYAVLSVAEHPL